MASYELFSVKNYENSNKNFIKKYIIYNTIMFYYI